MKKNLLTFILLILAGLGAAQAYDFSAVAPSGQTLYYNISGSTVTVTTQNSTYPYYSTVPTGTLTIPSSVTYNSTTYTVTHIGNYAFYGCSGLTSVTIPDSVTSIGNWAFYVCRGLTGALTIPNSVTSIGYAAFWGCTGLTTVTIPNTVNNIGNYAFNNIRHIEYHGTATGSPWHALSMNGVTDGDFIYSDSTQSHLVSYLGNGGSVAIPNSVTHIGNYAFSSCSGLTSVTIPNSVTNIGSYTFDGCSGLTSVTIGNAVDSIGANAFRGCIRLTTLYFNADSCVYAGGVYSNSYTNTNNYDDRIFYGCDSIRTVTFGNNIKVIPAYLLYNCIGLTSVTIGNSITNIGNSAFSGCSGLTTLNFNADSCVSVGNSSSNSAFYGCDSIRTVTFGNNVKIIPAYLLYNCIRLTSVTIPDSVTNIGNGAFSGCSGLTSITIPNSVTSIGQSAFYNCSGLTSVTIGNSVTRIENYAFQSCSGLTTLNFNADSCVSAGSDYSYYNRSFIDCANIRTVNFGSNVRIIPAYLLYNCTRLTSVTIPNTVTNIGNDAFYLVRHIEYYGTATGSPWGALSMNGETDGDFIYSDSSRTHLLLYIGAGGTVTIPNTVTRIGTDAFYNCSGLMSVTIPSSVTRIDNHAFHNCSGLTTLNFNADSCVFAGISHDSCAFYGCDSIATVNFGNSVRVIPPYLLYNCTRLTSVTLPDSVTTIGNQAFVGCSSLSSVSIPSSITSIGSNAFYDCSTLTTVIFRQGTGTSDTITVSSADTTMGTGCISQVRPNGVTVTAMQKIGYWFSHWSDGSQENPHAVGVTVGTMAAHYTTTRPQSACPGLKNPAAFTDGSTTGQYIGYYSGQTGSKYPPQQPVSPNITGMNMTSQEYSSNELAPLASSQSTAYCGTTLESGKRFRIMSAFEGPGTDANMGKDPLTGYGLPYVPPVSVTDGAVFSSSIRIGNCQTGAEAEGLYYTMTVRPQNTLMTLYFAIVVQAPGHGYAQDPTFCIRVCRNTGTDANPVWTPISDTLAYFVPTTGLQNNVNGWHQFGSGTGTNTIMWREWNKASVNVCKYMYEKIRVEVYMSDCAPHGHYGYCYVAGDCQPMFIQTSGCPAGSAARVQTLMAPSGLEGYVWYRSDNDGLEIPNETIPPSTINFRRLTPNSGNTSNNYIYDCTVQDFYCHAGAHAGQYTNNMVFRCDIKSRMNPDQPYWTPVYVRVINNKPMPSIDTMKNCDLWLQLVDKSYILGDQGSCDTSRTQWTIHSDFSPYDPVDTILYGGKVEHIFPQAGFYAVDVRTFRHDDTACYTDNTYTVKVLERPVPVLEVSQHRFNEGDQITLVDRTEGSVRRDWIFHSGDSHDTLFMGDSVIVESFDQPKIIIEMMTYNGLWYEDSTVADMRHWCTAIAQDTIRLNSAGISVVELSGAKIYAHCGRLVVGGAEGQQVRLYDAVGCLLVTRKGDYTPLYFDVPSTGTYLVRVGNYPARRIVIVK